MTEDRAPSTATATEGDDSRAVVAQNDAAGVKNSARPRPLVGIRIPSRNQHTRDLVVRVYEENVHLQRADVWAVTRYAELSWKFRRLSSLMDRMGDAGLIRRDQEPRKLLSELRALSDSILRHERDLGVTAASRAALGVDLSRMRQYAQGSQEPVEEAEIAALEARLVDRLAGTMPT